MRDSPPQDNQHEGKNPRSRDIRNIWSIIGSRYDHRNLYQNKDHKTLPIGKSLLEPIY